MIKNLPKEKRDQLLLICTLTLAIALGAYFGLVKMQKRNLESIAQKTADQQEKVGNAARLVNTHKDTEEELEDDLQKLKSIEQHMASGDMYSWIITTINRFRADRIRRALESTIRDGKVLTRDLGGSATTKEFADAVISHIA